MSPTQTSPNPAPLLFPCPVPKQGVAYALYVVSNNGLYNCTRLATLAVGGAMAVRGAVSAEQLTAFMFYTGAWCWGGRLDSCLCVRVFVFAAALCWQLVPFPSPFHP